MMLTNNEIKKILIQFCSERNDGKFLEMSKPFNQGGYSFATDSFIIIRTKLIDGFRESSKPNTKKLPWLDPKKKVALKALPPLPKAKNCSWCDGTGKVKKCPECEGEGEIHFANGFNSYYINCITCQGEGRSIHGSGPSEKCGPCKGTKEESGGTMNVGNKLISREIVNKLKSLVGVKWDLLRGALKPIPFTFDGGDGLAMPMKPGNLRLMSCKGHLGL